MDGLSVSALRGCGWGGLFDTEDRGLRVGNLCEAIPQNRKFCARLHKILQFAVWKVGTYL